MVKVLLGGYKASSTQAVWKLQSVKLPELDPLVAVLQHANAASPLLVTHVIEYVEQFKGLPANS